MSEEFAKKPTAGEPWDVAIIGSGPAALTAGIYTTRGAASTVIVGGERWGGQLMLTTTVDNFPGFPEGVHGPDLMQKMRDQAVRFGAEFVEKNVHDINVTQKPFLVHVGETTYLAKSVILATGALTKWLDIPGEKELIGKGISSCAPCDAPFFKDKNVVVVGGGDSAMEEALVLSKYASLVTIIHRRDAFKASAAMQQKVLANPKIKVIWNGEVVQAIGQERLTAIVVKNNKDNTQTQMPVDGMFVAIGHKPDSDIFIGKVETDEKGYITRNQTVIDDTPFHSATNVPGIFVAGDVHDHHYKQAVTASGFGCMAGMDVLKFLDKGVPTW